MCDGTVRQPDQSHHGATISFARPTDRPRICAGFRSARHSGDGRRRCLSSRQRSALCSDSESHTASLGRPRSTQPKISSASSWRERERGELDAGCPSHILAELRGRSATKVAAEEVQLNLPICVRVRSRQQSLANRAFDAQLLLDFTNQAGGGCLSRLALASRELPAACEMNAFLATCQKKAIALFDDRGGDDDRRPSGHCLVDAIDG